MVLTCFLTPGCAAGIVANMARKLRIEYPGAVYHVMNRGDRRAAIFRPEPDYHLFLQTLAEACKKAGWQVHAYPSYLAPPRRRPAWLRVDRLLGDWGLPKDSAAGRGVFAAGLERRWTEDLRTLNRRIERGWFVGNEEFRRELLAQVTAAPGVSHYGEVVQEAVAQQAERFVAERLHALGWRAADLRARRKGDPAKVKPARAVRAQTTMPLAWIANRLAMGRRGYLTWLLHRQRVEAKI